jgi:hypothetical protein
MYRWHKIARSLMAPRVTFSVEARPNGMRPRLPYYKDAKLFGVDAWGEHRGSERDRCANLKRWWHGGNAR